MAYSYKDLYDLYKDDKKVDNVPQSGGAYTFDVLSDIYGAGVTDDNEDYASQLFDPKNVENYKAQQIESDAINQKITPKDESVQDYEENQENSGIFGKIKNLFSKSKKKYEDLKEPEINISENEYTYYTPLVLERLNNVNKELSEYEKRLQERSPGLKLLDFLSGKGRYNSDAWGEKGEKKDFKTILKESKEDSENFKKEIKTKTQEYKAKDKTLKGELKNVLGILNENKYSQGLIVPQDQAEEVALISEKMKYAEELSNFLAREDVKTGFWDGLKHSIQEGRFVPFAYNVGQNARMGNMQEALGKLTDEEREVLDIRAIREKYQGTDELSEYELTLLENMQMDLINSRVDKGIPYGLGESLVDMGRYGLEFAMLEGIAKGITSGAKAIKPIAKILPKSRANSFVSKLAGEMTQTLVQTGINVPAVENKTLEYTLPQHDLVAGENGDMLLKQVSEGDEPLKAFTKGFASVYVETFSEKVGGLITRREAGQVYRTITKRLGLVVKDPENFIQKSVIGRVLSKRNDKTLTVFGEYLKKSGFNGILQEIFEEEFNEPFQAKLDSREYYNPVTTPEGRTRLIMEAIGIGMYGGLLKIPDKTVNQIYKWRDKRQPKPIDIPIEEDEKIPEENLPEVIKEELQNLQQEENVPDELAGIEDIIATDGVTEGVEDGEFDINELNELEGGPVEKDVQEVTEQSEEDVTPESDIFQEYNDTESGYFEDEFIGKGTFKEAIDNIGGPDNVERRTVDRVQIQSTENVSLDTERGQRALEEIKSGKRVPIVARPTGPNTFEVEDGNHRLKAYGELKINKIPIITTKQLENQVEGEVPEGIAIETEEEKTPKMTAEQVAIDLIKNYVKRGDDMSSLHSLGAGGGGNSAEVKKDMIVIKELNGEDVDIRLSLKKVYDSIKQNEEISQESKKEPVKEKQKKPAKKKNYFGDNSFKGQKDYPTFDKPPLLNRENQGYYEEGDIVIDKDGRAVILTQGNKKWENSDNEYLRDINDSTLHARYIGNKGVVGHYAYATQVRVPTSEELKKINAFIEKEEGPRSEKENKIEEPQSSKRDDSGVKSSEFVKGEMNRLKALRKEQLDLRKLETEGKIDHVQLLTRWREIDKEVQEGLDYMEQMEMVEKELLIEAKKYKTADEFIKALGYEKRYHQTSPENARKINTEGFRTDIKGSGKSDFLPNGVNTKISDTPLSLHSSGEQMEIYFPKGLNVKKFKTRAEAEHFFRYEGNEETGNAIDKIFYYEKKAIEEVDKLDEARVSAKDRKEALDILDKQQKILDFYEKKIDEAALVARQKTTELTRKLKIDVIEIEEDLGGFKRTTDNTIVINPQLIKTKTQLTDIWRKANEEGSKSNKPDIMEMGEKELLIEAKKYKTAEEFVQSKSPYYHRTNESFDMFDTGKQKSGVSKGVYLMDNLEQANTPYMKQRFGKNLIEAYPTKPIADLANDPKLGKLVGNSEKAAQLENALKKQGYGGYKFLGETVVFDSKDIVTRKQLTDIWRKANEEGSKSNKPDIMEMGEKIWKGHEDSYKLTRDEFVDIGLEYFKKTDKEYKETKDKGWYELTTRNSLIDSYNQLVKIGKAGTYRDKAKLLDIDLPETFSSKLQEQSLLELVNNSDKLINEYIEKFTKPSGNIHVNGDNAKTLFTGYDKTGDAPFDIAGGNLAKLVYRRALELKKDDVLPILFSSGGPGSGKSSVTDDIQDLYSIYFDSNLGNMERGLQRIDEALKYKKKIDILHVNRDATDAFVDGVLRRFKEEDPRTVPVVTHVNQHIVAVDVMKELVKRFNKSREVKVIVVNNNLGYRKHKKVEPSYLDNIHYDKDSLINKLNNHVRQKYNENEITKAQAVALLGGEAIEITGGIKQGDREEHSETEEQRKPEPVDRLQLKKDIMGELSFELSLGLENNPGKMRTGNGDTIDYKWYGAKSFYPSWVPEHLHNRKAVEAVIDKLNSDNPKLIKLRKDSKAEEILNLYKAEANKRYRERMYQLGYGAEEPTSTNPLEGIEDDIPLDLAVRAHEGTSYSPEKRGQSRVDEYIDIMKSDYALLKKYADTKEKVNQLNEMFERYREGYKKRTLDMLSSHSRIVSSMIAGPSRFPTSTMRKRNDSYDNKVRESIEYRDKILAKIKNTLNPTTSAVISQSDPDALVKLKERLKALEDWHEKMVQINKIIRSGKDIEQKLEKLELSEKIKDQILIKGGELNNGIPSYSLRNNKGKIKQVKDRITRLEKIKSIESTETPFDGGKILMNTDEARIQIFFDSKPDSATRDKLKKNAFRWSPRNQAWQRQLTMNAIRATEGLFNVSVKRGKVKPISTSVDASIGMYATDEEISLNFTPEEVAEKMLDQVPPSIQMPEMANIFRQLTEGNFIEIRNKMGNKLGYHKAGTIKMLGKLFIDEEQSTKILAHEIGHLIDYLPTKTTKRGNLLGRLATLNRYMKGKLINEEKQKKVESLVDERIKFQERRRDLKELKKKTNAGPKAYKAEDTQFLREIKRINKEIKELQKDAVYNKTVTAELKNLTMLWRPFDIDANESFTNYRFSAKELYADAISVLFVRPDILKAKAPTFLKTFLAFAYKKPKVFNSLLDSYTILYRGPEAIGKERSKKFMSMIATGEDAYTAQIAEIQDSKTGLKFLMKYLLLDENQAVIDKVNELKKKGIHLSAEENPIHALESNNYIDAKVKAFLEKYILPVEKRLTKANVTWEQLGEILFLERVRDERGGLVTLIDVIEDRKPQIADLILETLSHIQNMTVFEQYTYLENNLPADHWAEIKSVLPAGIANPLGYTTTSAKQQLKYLKGFYSAEKWDQLMKAKEEFRLANKEIIRRAKDVGYYTPELIEKMESNDSYATFQVIEYLDLYVSPAVRGQKGTFKDIANPAISTIMKNVSIITAIERNETKKKIVGMLSKHFPKDIEKARTKWIGKGQMILDTKETGKGTIKLVVNGKLEGFNVDKYIANTVNIMNDDTLIEMGALLSIPNKFYRPVFTSLNLGFQSFNFVRDFVRYWKNVPDDSLAGALTSLPRAFYRYAQAAPSAWGRASNKPDKLIAEMDELGVLGVTWNDMFNNPDKADVQIDRILVKADLKAINPRQKQRLFIRPFAKVLNVVETLGNFIETFPKVAGYIELKGKMPDAELARFIRTRVGSPDFRRKGAATPVTNNLFLFSNAIKEGWRADLASATDPKTRAGWAWKTMLVSLMPKLLMFLIAKGWLGEELEKMMNDASEYDKTNYVMIPLGRAKNGKTEFLRVPQDETGRFLGGLFWKGLNSATDDDVNLQDLFNILDYGAGQFPSVSPIFTGSGAVINYLSGRNPYDSFRGRYIIPDDEFKAGPKYSAPIFLEWLIQNQGAGMVLPNINALRDVEITNLEKVINAPILANTLGRWIKVTDQGRREAEYEPVLDEQQKQSVEKIEKKKSLEGYVAQFLETDRSESEMNYYIRLFTEEELGPGPYKGTVKAQATNLKKSFMKEYFFRTGEKQLSTLKSLGSNAEKRAYINSVKYNMTEEEFEVFLSEALKAKFISENVYNEF